MTTDIVIPITRGLAHWIYECWQAADARRSLYFSYASCTKDGMPPRPEVLNNLYAVDQDGLDVDWNKDADIAKVMGLWVHICKVTEMHLDIQSCLQNQTQALNRISESMNELILERDAVTRDTQDLAVAAEELHQKADTLRHSAPFVAASLALKEWDLWDYDNAVKTHRPETIDLYKELIQLEDHFGEVHVKTKPGINMGSFSVVTRKNVVFEVNGETLDFGKFKLLFRSGYGLNRIHMNNNQTHPTVVALNPLWAVDDNGEETDYPHPNVSGSNICMGHGLNAWEMANSGKRFFDSATLMEAVLFNQDSDSPYHPLDEWHGGDNGICCDDCGGQTTEDERYYCEDCQNTICSECFERCQECEAVHCYNCIQRCDETEQCTAFVCKITRCIEAHLQEAHPITEEEEEEEKNESQFGSTVFGSPNKTPEEVESDRIRKQYEPIAQEV
jgi:hypothetical protein